MWWRKHIKKWKPLIGKKNQKHTSESGPNYWIITWRQNEGRKVKCFFSTDIDLDTHAWLFLLLESLHHVWLFATLWTAAHYATLSMEFSRQEYWSRLPFPSPGDLSNSGIKPVPPALAGTVFTTEPPGSPTGSVVICSVIHSGLGN